MGGHFHKVPYPKHVWSPAGGWYCQPTNWKSNTVVAGIVMVGIVALAFKFGTEREIWTKRPEPGAFAPSRLWSRHLIEMDRQAAREEAESQVRATAGQASEK